MDTFTIVLLGWGLYSVIHYFEKSWGTWKSYYCNSTCKFADYLVKRLW